MPQFYTIGYGKWPAKTRFAALVAALKKAGVTTLIDIRHSPCASQLDPENTYGPREWHVQAGGTGIVAKLKAEGIAYWWVVELGNPQKTDRDMAVLTEHLADPEGGWPVHRGLALVASLIEQGGACCLMCACEKYAECHRRPVAEALLARLPEGTVHRDLVG